MRRRILSVTASLAALLALPALAQASTTGTVLSVAPAQHEVQIIGANRVVSGYHYSGTLNGLHRGNEVSYTPVAGRITRVQNLGTVSTFSFLGKVVQSGTGGLVLALGDQQHLRLAARSTRSRHIRTAAMRGHCSCGGSAPTVNVEIRGLGTGETVLVTESTSSDGTLTITITLPSAGGSGGGSASEITATGDVNNVNTDTFDILTADGSDLNFHMAATPLANLGMSYCDSVVVSYHMDANLMIADNVVDNGPSTDSSCADSGAGGTAGQQDAIGTITAVSDTSITIDAGPDAGGVQTFTVNDPSIVDGFQIGDSVDVTYEQDGNLLVADDVEYN